MSKYFEVACFHANRYCAAGTPHAGILKVEKELAMALIFGEEAYTVWLRLVTFQVFQVLIFHITWRQQ